MKSDLIDLTLVEIRRTDKAILVAETPDEDSTRVWLPLSLVEIVEISASVVEVTLTERLATEKGLV